MSDQVSSSSSPASMSTQLLESLDTKIQRNTTNYAARSSYGESFVSLVYRIPAEIRELNKGAYIPSVVSIGPFHIYVLHLQIMEADKLSYMHELFSRFGDHLMRNGCVDVMLKMESNARKWYGKLNIRADTEESRKVKFAEMMLVDGCFIIELLYRNYLRITFPSSEKFADPILDNYSMKCAVQHDLIRLENQIPFPVLDQLFNLTVGSVEHDDDPQFSLKKCIFLFFKGVMGLQSMPDSEQPLPFHVLDYFHFLYQPSGNPSEVKNEGRPGGDCFRTDNEQSIFRYSATQLDLAGVKFRPRSKTNLFDVNFSTNPSCFPMFRSRHFEIPHSETPPSPITPSTETPPSPITSSTETNLFDVKFSTNPSCFQMFRSRHFEIPPFPITSSTETFLRNLIAMEQFYEDRYHYFTSHAFLMDKLIDTAKDVDLLVEAGVIHNYLGSSEEVARLYNNINKNVYTGGFHFTKPCNEVTEYCNRFWPRSLAKLKRDYFGNPWTGLSVFVAFSIFVLTLLQTIYAMK